MGWDDQDKGNPWKPGGDKGRPADLDAIVRDFQRKLAGLFGRRGGGRGGLPDGAGGGGVNGALIAGGAVVAVALWGLTGFYRVDAAERGVVLRFGEHRETTLPGLHWHLPWPIETVEQVNIDVTERYAYQGSMLTRDENIVIVDLVVQYRRSDPLAYLFALRDPESTLRDVTGSAIREIIGKNVLDFILTEGRTEVAAQTRDLIQSTLDTYGTGITVYEVNLQEANFPNQVEAAVQDAIMAREDRERMALEAESYANDVVPRARGAAAREIEEAEAYRARVVANAEGEASRFSQILTEYSRAPRVTRERLYLETLEQIMASSTKVLLDNEGEGGGSLIYLPLDRLVEQQQQQQQRRSEGGRDTPQVLNPSSMPMTNNLESRSSRERTVR